MGAFGVLRCIFLYGKRELASATQVSLKYLGLNTLTLWQCDSLTVSQGWLSDLTADVCFWPGCHWVALLLWPSLPSSARLNKNKIGCQDAEKYFTASGNLHSWQSVSSGKINLTGVLVVREIQVARIRPGNRRAHFITLWLTSDQAWWSLMIF